LRHILHHAKAQDARASAKESFAGLTRQTCALACKFSYFPQAEKEICYTEKIGNF